MPVRDPNKIDVLKAIRLYDVLRDWNWVAEILKRPNGQPYTTNAIYKAVLRHDRQPSQEVKQ